MIRFSELHVKTNILALRSEKRRVTIHGNCLNDTECHSKIYSKAKSLSPNTILKGKISAPQGYTVGIFDPTRTRTHRKPYPSNGYRFLTGLTGMGVGSYPWRVTHECSNIILMYLAYYCLCFCCTSKNAYR